MNPPKPEGERRDAVYEEIRELRRELNDHISEEMPMVRTIMTELGSPEQVRQRRIFIEAWIERERERAKLRRAVIEKGVIVALAAVVAFVLTAIYHELISVLRDLLSGTRK